MLYVNKLYILNHNNMTYTLSLQEYLKKFSSISNKFIDDFFGLFNEETNDDDFVIDIDAVS